MSASTKGENAIKRSFEKLWKERRRLKLPLLLETDSYAQLYFWYTVFLALYSFLCSHVWGQVDMANIPADAI